MNLLLTALGVVAAATFALQAAVAQTLVVDAANGPGTNFTDLATATAAAPSGAVLIVRPGDYGLTQIMIQGKSLTVLAEPGAILAGSTMLSISGITAAQSVLVRGFAMQAPTLTFGGIVVNCESNAGLVCLENMTVGGGSIGSVSLIANGCAALWLRGCTFSAVARFTNCEGVARNCTMSGNAQSISTDSFVQNGGSVQLVDCILKGFSGFAGSPAAQLNGGSLRLLGSTSLTGGSGLVGSAGLAIAGTGSVRRDTGVSLTGGGTVVAPTITMATTNMPYMTVDEVPPAGTLAAALHGPHGHVGFLLVSLIGSPFPLPFLVDTVWLDPFSMLIVTSGVPGPGAPVAASISMPAISTTLGFKICWQGLTVDAVAGFQISNAEYSVVH